MTKPDSGAEATRRMLRKVDTIFGGDGERLRLVQEELQLLSEAYAESATYNACRDCDAQFVDGEPHNHGCQFAAVEARALLRVREQEKAKERAPARESQGPASPRDKGFACGRAYRSLPDSEKASIEWQAHAERIIKSLCDTGHLKVFPDADH